MRLVTVRSHAPSELRTDAEVTKFLLSIKSRFCWLFRRMCGLLHSAMNCSCGTDYRSPLKPDIEGQRALDWKGKLPVFICRGSKQGGVVLAGSDGQKVLDTAMLECLAFLAESQGRSVVEELNLAVKTYVLQQFSHYEEHGHLEKAFSDSTPAKTS